MQNISVFHWYLYPTILHTLCANLCCTKEPGRIREDRAAALGADESARCMVATDGMVQVVSVVKKEGDNSNTPMQKVVCRSRDELDRLEGDFAAIEKHLREELSGAPSALTHREHLLANSIADFTRGFCFLIVHDRDFVCMPCFHQADIEAQRCNHNITVLTIAIMTSRKGIQRPPSHGGQAMPH